MGALKIVVRILSYICYAVIGVYALICMPMIFGAKPEAVFSGSMRPEYEIGTIIYYRQVPKEEIAIGDVITFQMGNDLVTHRVHRIENDAYITKGDANNTEDQVSLSYSDIKGKVGGIKIPILGYGIKFINSNMWVFLIIVAILVAEFLLSNIKSGKISVSEKGQNHEQET